VVKTEAVVVIEEVVHRVPMIEIKEGSINSVAK